MVVSQRVKASQLEEVDLGSEERPKPVNIAKEMPRDEKKAMVELLTSFRDVFAWSYEDMRGLDPQLYQHQIHLSTDAKPVVQRCYRIPTMRLKSSKKSTSKTSNKKNKQHG